jgi:hypothetical protein
MMQQYEMAQDAITQAIRLVNDDERPWEKSASLIVFTLFAGRTSEAIEKYQHLISTCQSAHFLQYVLFLLRTFATLSINERVAQDLCERLQTRIAAMPYLLQIYNL